MGDLRIYDLKNKMLKKYNRLATKTVSDLEKDILAFKTETNIIIYDFKNKITEMYFFNYNQYDKLNFIIPDTLMDSIFEFCSKFENVDEWKEFSKAQNKLRSKIEIIFDDFISEFENKFEGKKLTKNTENEIVDFVNNNLCKKINYNPIKNFADISDGNFIGFEQDGYPCRSFSLDILEDGTIYVDEDLDA